MNINELSGGALYVRICAVIIILSIGIIFLCCCAASIVLHDYFYNQRDKEIAKQEVKNIL